MVLFIILTFQNNSAFGQTPVESFLIPETLSIKHHVIFSMSAPTHTRTNVHGHEGLVQSDSPPGMIFKWLFDPILSTVY